VAMGIHVCKNRYVDVKIKTKATKYWTSLDIIYSYWRCSFITRTTWKISALWCDDQTDAAPIIFTYCLIIQSGFAVIGYLTNTSP